MSGTRINRSLKTGHQATLKGECAGEVGFVPGATSGTRVNRSLKTVLRPPQRRVCRRSGIRVESNERNASQSKPEDRPPATSQGECGGDEWDSCRAQRAERESIEA